MWKGKVRSTVGFFPSQCDPSEQDQLRRYSIWPPGGAENLAELALLAGRSLVAPPTSE